MRILEINEHITWNFFDTKGRRKCNPLVLPHHLHHSDTIYFTPTFETHFGNCVLLSIDFSPLFLLTSSLSFCMPTYQWRLINVSPFRRKGTTLMFCPSAPFYNAMIHWQNCKYQVLYTIKNLLQTNFISRSFFTFCRLIESFANVIVTQERFPRIICILKEWKIVCKIKSVYYCKWQQAVIAFIRTRFQQISWLDELFP